MPKILLVDKDETFINSCRGFFQGYGFSVEHVSEIDEIPESLDFHRPDLIVLNMDVPSSAISSILPAIQQQTYDFYIILYSVHKNPGSDYGSLMGLKQIRGFLVRPFPIYRLGEMVAKIFPIEEDDVSKPISSTEQATSWLGKNLADCTLEKCLSQGNFSLVYLGKYQDNPVVVKILANIGMEQKVRFQREVEVLARFKHPHIIEIIMTGQTPDGVYYMVTPFFESENLDQILAQDQKLALWEAGRIIYQIAQGMAAVHTTQVIHRDLKPANILYNRDQGIAKVIDFGLVRDIGVNQAITKRGYILGTPYYMSPEQCEGRLLDARTDIYSLGITFYQLITGLVPFDKSSPIKTLLAHIRDPITWPDNIKDTIPDIVQNFIEKMSAKKNVDRFQSMSDVANGVLELKNILGWNF